MEVRGVSDVEAIVFCIKFYVLRRAPESTGKVNCRRFDGGDRKRSKSN